MCTVPKTFLTVNTNPIHLDAAEYAAETEWERPLVDSTFTLVTVRTRGLNQRDEAVIEFERSILLSL